MTNRRKYTKEFKMDAVKLVIDNGYSQEEAARNLGISHSVIGRWVRDYKVKQDEALNGHEKQKDNRSQSDQEELRKLRLEVQKLRMEREILKKAAAFFAKEST